LWSIGSLGFALLVSLGLLGVVRAGGLDVPV
jgi:hypothetical protein